VGLNNTLKDTLTETTEHIPRLEKEMSEEDYKSVIETLVQISKKYRPNFKNKNKILYYFYT
jgi:flagellar motor component MotA